MADKPAGERTEQPTPKRKREARQRGQIARTPELSLWLSLLGTTLLLQITAQRGTSAMRKMLDRMGTLIAHPDTATAARFARDGAFTAVGIVAPMVIGMMVIGLVVNIGQVGFKPTGKKMKPDFSKLNPFKGIKKMVSMSTWWEVLKSVLKVGVLAAVSLPAMSAAAHTLTTTKSGASMWEIARITATTATTMLRNLAAAGLVIAAADYIVQRVRLNRQLRMTRQELREELKQQEVSPEMKRAIRSRASAISRNRMIRMVSAADVVVVNPTHYAVALRYDATHGAPQVLAKGAGEIAARIREQAERHGVPIVREPVLTRTLYRSCEVGQLIPVELYEAVAHLLAFVFSLRAKGRAQGFHDLPRPALL